VKYNTDNHHFTIVIPSRERCDTLEHSLHTCVVQDYDNLDILVSDNFSQDHTREVVNSFKDRRIRYVNTGKRVSMTDNFEFGLSHVRPKGYIIYIGDDDGLLPNAIRDINTVINQTGTSVLRWALPYYWWPNITSNLANQMVIPSLRTGITVRQSVSTIQNILSFREHYTQYLPLMYQYSAIEYKVINRIKSISGKFYHSMTPDVYSGFAIAGTVDTFVYSERPYAIGGVSRHSNGVSCTSISLGAPTLEYLSEDNPPFHPNLVFIPGSIPLVVIECYLQAEDHLQLSKKFTVDLEKMVFLVMVDAAPKAQELYIVAKEAVLQLGDMHGILKAAQEAIEANPKREFGSGKKLTVRNITKASLQMTRLFVTDLCMRRFYLDCSSLNVKNIYDASRLCDHVLRLTEMKYLGSSAIRKSSLSNIKRIIADGKIR
jgi:hypothetical protein